MTNLFTRSLRNFTSLLIPVILIAGVIRLIPTDAYLSVEYGKTSFPADSFGFDPGMRFTHASTNLKYVRTGAPISALSDQKHSQAALYNSQELKHMIDVQNVYTAVNRLWTAAILLLLVVGILFWVRSGSLAFTISAIKTGSLLTAGLVGAVGLLAVIAWQAWFVLFHEIFFTAGSWTFSATDTLIRLFPEKFWFDTAVNVSAASLIAGLILFFFSSLLERRLRRSVNPISSW